MPENRQIIRINTDPDHTGISVFAFSASYVKKSEYNEIDKTARTIIKNFEICLNSSDSRETAVSDMERFFAVYSDVFDTNYYILDKDGGIIVKNISLKQCQDL